MVCENYTGIACVDGSCPIALSEEYAEAGCDIVHDCSECGHYKGCEDCYFHDDDSCRLKDL